MRDKKHFLQKMKFLIFSEAVWVIPQFVNPALMCLLTLQNNMDQGRDRLNINNQNLKHPRSKQKHIENVAYFSL